MENKSKKLFPYGVCFEVSNNGYLMQDRYGEMDDEKVNYIENAVIMYDEVVNLLDILVNSGFEFNSDSASQNIRSSIVETLRKAKSLG